MQFMIEYPLTAGATVTRVRANSLCNLARREIECLAQSCGPTAANDAAFQQVEHG